MLSFPLMDRWFVLYSVAFSFFINSFIISLYKLLKAVKHGESNLWGEKTTELFLRTCQRLMIRSGVSTKVLYYYKKKQWVLVTTVEDNTSSSSSGSNIRNTSK